jgi:hypothetical protein
MAATVLTAFSLRKPVNVTGTGTCPIWPDSESVSTLIVDQ